MATIRNIPRGTRMPSLRGSVMLDTWRGVLRVRKWPKKRGTPKSALQRWWIDWFRQANLLAKYADGMTQARAIALTKHSGLYPRDIMLRAMRGRLYWWTDQDGNRWYPMAGIQDISDTLDILAKKVGDVLVRAVDRWRPAGPPTPVAGHALTYQGPNLPPIWAVVGAGVSEQDLAGTPITVDNTQNAYVLDVTGYASVNILLDQIVCAVADYPQVRVSLDGGASYRFGATDYTRTFLTSAAETAGQFNAMQFSRQIGTSAHNCQGEMRALRAGRPSFKVDAAYSTTQVARIAHRMNFDGPVTHIKVYSNGGNNFTTGTIRAAGFVAA